MTPIQKWDVVSYPEELASNIRAQRARAKISQQTLAARMRRLGFAGWVYQTAQKSENAQRPVTAAEVMGLCMALECTVWDLMVATPSNHLVGDPGHRKGHHFHGLTGRPEDVDVAGARTITGIAQGIWDGSIRWDGENIAVRHISAFGDTDMTDLTGRDFPALEAADGQG